MDFEDFIGQLNESGPDSILYHYTDLLGLINILYTKKISSQIYWTSISGKNNLDTANINEKNNVGRFIIHYHIINDYIRNIKKTLINELYTQRLERLNNLISIKNKNQSVIDEIDVYKKLIKQSVIEREAEERIISDNIPLDYQNYTIKFEFITIPDLSQLHKKSNNRLYELIKKPYFIENNYYNYIVENITLII